MGKIKNLFGHIKTVHTHRKWVRHYCFKAGLYRQGLTHDLSKYSPTEFFESIKYYTGTCSPIDICKKEKGYSAAWMHHKGRNKHHYEFWMDNFDNGCEALIMPYKYALEMVCDNLGASRAYNGTDFSFKLVLEWWFKKKEKPLAMHPANQAFITGMFACLNNCKTNREIKEILKNKSLELYWRSVVDWENSKDIKNNSKNKGGRN